MILPSDGETANELISEGFSLSDGAETASSDLLGVQLNGVLWEVEPLLDDGRQFTDATALLAEDVLGPRGHDDDLGTGRSDADLDAGVAVFGEFAGQELVELSPEHAIGDELKQGKSS